MLAKNGTTFCSLSVEDLQDAVEEWLNSHCYNDSKVKIVGFTIHRAGSKSAVTVEVVSEKTPQ